MYFCLQCDTFKRGNSLGQQEKQQQRKRGLDYPDDNLVWSFMNNRSNMPSGNDSGLKTVIHCSLAGIRRFGANVMRAALPVYLMAVSCSSFAGEFTANTNVVVRLDPKPAFGQESAVWQDGIGTGFRKGTEEGSFAIGTGIGIVGLGGTETHDFVLGRVGYSRVLTDVLGDRSWFRGNLEGGAELLGGEQYYHREAYFFGLTPVLRYSFATGSRWVPFLDGGAGISLTDIGRPDLSSVFQFNLQAGTGCRYFLTDHLALTLQYRFIHISNARIATPNHGVNSNLIYLGISRFF